MTRLIASIFALIFTLMIMIISLMFLSSGQRVKIAFPTPFPEDA